MNTGSFPRAHRPGVAATILVVLLALGPPDAHAANRSWLNAVSGSASTASNWSPAIAPTYLDTALLYANGTYTISWASPQDTLFAMYSYGTPTLSISGNLGVNGTFDVVTGELATGSGVIRAGQVIVGADGGTGTLRVQGGLASNGSVVHASTSSPLILANAGSVANGFDRANVYLTGGGTLLSNSTIETSRSTFTSTHVYVSGSRNLFGSVYRSTLGTLTAAGGGGRGDMVFGAGGGTSSNTTIEVFDGGVLDVKGSLYTGRGGSGILHLYETVANTNPRAYIYQNAFVGNDPSSANAYPGNLLIDGGTVLIGGLLSIGDSDHTSGSNGTGHVRITGGKTVLGSRIVMYNTLGGTLEMSGGTLRLLSGISEIHQDPAFNLSSSVGSPEMIVNGTATVRSYPTSPDPIALGVGRGGAGLLRVCGPSARVELQGDMAIADSVGGSGIVQVDTSGVVSGDFPITLGAGGTLSVSNDAIVSSVSSPIYCSGAISLDSGFLLSGDGSVLDPDGTIAGTGFVHGTWETHGSIEPSGVMSFDHEIHNVGGAFSGGGTVQITGAFYAGGTAGISLDASGAHLYPHDYPAALPPAPFGAARPALALRSARPSRAAGVPDAPLGHLHLTGDLTLSSLSTTVIRIGSAASGERDSLEADGAANIDGVLELVSIAGNEPAQGDTITVLEAGSVSGTFASVTLDGMDASGEVGVLYSATDVKVVILQSTAVGDPTPSASPTALRFAATMHGGASWLVLDLPSAARVRVTVYDVSGREIARLADDTYPSGGRFEFPMPSVASGMYFARARIDAGTGRIEKTARVSLLR